MSKDIINKLATTMIETAVITPIFIFIIILVVLAVLFYYFKHLRYWFGMQAVRLLNVWEFYMDDKDNFYEVQDE